MRGDPLLRHEHLTREELKCFLHYNLETGIFTWVKCKSRNNRVGDVAGTISEHGYVVIGLNKRSYYAHRLAFLYVLGEFPSSITDHENGNRSDNRWINLRQATRLENTLNTSLRSNNKSGVKGVWWDKVRSCWVSVIIKNGKGTHVGYFDDIESAAIAVAKRRLEIHKEFSNNGSARNYEN